MKKVLFVLSLCQICIVSTLAQEKLDGIVAVVGDEIILNSELEAYSNIRLKQDSTLTLTPELKGTFLDELIDGRVLIVHAKQDTTISVKDGDVELALSNQLSMMARQNSLTPEGLEAAIKAQGMNIIKFKSQMRKQIKDQLYKDKIQQKFVGGYKVGKVEVESFYTRYKDSLPQAGPSIRLAMLAIKLAPSDSVRQAAYDCIRRIKERLDNGEEFVACARTFSDDPNAAQGGDLGFIEKGTLSELKLEAKVFSLKPGEISDVFETRLGFHIIMVETKKGQSVHARQILAAVTPSEKRMLAIVAQLDSIRTACKDSNAFVAAVRAYSQDTLSKRHDGEMPWMQLVELSSSIASAIDSLPVGSISGPVLDNNVYTIYRVNERVENRALTLQNDWDKLAGIALRIAEQKKLVDLVKRWRTSTFIDKRV